MDRGDLLECLQLTPLISRLSINTPGVICGLDFSSHNPFDNGLVERLTPSTPNKSIWCLCPPVPEDYKMQPHHSW
jgi:hypothetical protein